MLTSPAAKTLNLPVDHYSSVKVFKDVPGVFEDNFPLDDPTLFLNCRDYADARGTFWLHVKYTKAPSTRIGTPFHSQTRPIQNWDDYISSSHARQSPLPSASIRYLDHQSEPASGSSGTSNTTSNREGQDSKSKSLLPDDELYLSSLLVKMEINEDLDIKSSPPTPLVKNAAVIGTEMVLSAAVAILALHRCKDITEDLHLTSCSEYPIATGGFGDIYRGGLKSGMRVAIKCMRIFDPLGSEEMQRKHLKHAARELHTWSKLNHPHILKLLGLVQYRERIGMVSPWIERGSLRRHLERTPTVDRPQMDNVLVSDGGEPLVTDFGSAVLKDRSLKFTSTTSGNQLSIRWTAPELFNDKPSSFKTDIFALGMTILEIITEYVPYAELRNDVAVICTIIKGGLPDRPREQISSRSEHGNMLWSLLEDCWAFEPGMRPGAHTVKDEVK
ncbi:hypothetical protein FRC07_007726 [Ceratobasidium sp. 392]|nr:hypothetical protein FRC07_007726 [Ceratobasidium sp. 392]